MFTLSTETKTGWLANLSKIFYQNSCAQPIYSRFNIGVLSYPSIPLNEKREIATQNEQCSPRP